MVLTEVVQVEVVWALATRKRQCIDERHGFLFKRESCDKIPGSSAVWPSIDKGILKFAHFVSPPQPASPPHTKNRLTGPLSVCLSACLPACLTVIGSDRAFVRTDWPFSGNLIILKIGWLLQTKLPTSPPSQRIQSWLSGPRIFAHRTSRFANRTRL